MAYVTIPTPLRPYVDNQSTLQVAGQTVEELLTTLADTYPDLVARLYDGSGQLKSYITLFVNGEHINHVTNGDTAVQPNDQLRFISALAGG